MMNRLAATCVLLVLVLASCAIARADAIAWSPEAQPELSLREKIEKSRAESRLSVIGRWSLPEEASPPTKDRDGAGFMPLRFTVEETLEGELVLPGTVLLLRIPVFLRDESGKPASPPAEVEEARKSLSDLERKLEAKTLFRDPYWKALLGQRDVIVRSSDYLKTHVLIPVRIGTSESWQRRTFIPVILGNVRYALFLGRGFPSSPLLSGDLDIYPADEMMRVLVP